MKKNNFKISGMTCANCADVIGKKVKELNGVSKAKVSLALNFMKVEANENVSDEAIMKAVQEAGYKAEKLTEVAFENKMSKELKVMLIQFGFALVLTIPMWIGMILNLANNHSAFTMFLHNPIFQLVITFIVEFIIGWRFFHDVYHGIKNKKLNMAFLIVIGTLAAIGLSIYNATVNNWLVNMQSHQLYFETAATIITLVLLGKILETIAKNKTTNSLKALTNLLPNDAVKLVDGKEIIVKLEDIKIGDTLVIKPGASIPLDGIVLNGSSYVNESMLTGESKPVKKKVGSNVTGATVNKEGVFEMKVTQIGENTTLSKIINLVKDAQSGGIEIQKTVDKVSAWFIPVIFLLAFMTFIGWTIYNGGINENVFIYTIAVLVIACPCALGLATPTAIMVGTGKAAQAGILFKGGNMLEKLAKLDTIVFDKTGTLTKGKMEVQEFNLLSKVYQYDEAVKILKLIESSSNHPIAQAIRNFEPKINFDNKIKVQNFNTVISYGIEGEINDAKVRVGKPKWFENHPNLTETNIQQINNAEKKGYTVFVLEINDEIVATIGVADGIKDNARELIKQLNHQKIKTILLTGDSKLTAEFVASELGIQTVYSEVLVQDKAKLIKKLQDQKEIVAMIGDGINDSVALTQADVGMSMSSGVDIAIESSDVVLMKDDLLEVVKAIKVARKTLRKIKSNLFWAFIYNVGAIPAAMFGYLVPDIAAGAMALSSVSVVVNSLFLRVKKNNEEKPYIILNPKTIYNNLMKFKKKQLKDVSYTKN